LEETAENGRVTPKWLALSRMTPFINRRQECEEFSQESIAAKEMLGHQVQFDTDTPRRFTN
jgi:hypothetical protein